MEGYIPRRLGTLIQESLADTPVVVVQGPRQCGKSTLVQEVCNLPYVTLDDSLSLDAAVHSPGTFLKTHPEGFIIDEVQRAPQLSRAVKAEVDRDRKPGRFVLTGSANIMALPKLADSLAGRMEVVSLWPLSQSEIEDNPNTFADWAFSDETTLPTTTETNDLTEKLLTGGFPEPVSRSSAKRRTAWFENYLKALIERDVRDLADIEGLTAMPRLLRVLARSAYDVTNVSALSRDTGLPATTLTRYLALLEGVFLLKTVPAWTALKQGKAAKTGRLAFTDSGILGHLTNLTATSDIPPYHWENFVATELIKQTGWSETTYTVQHFRSVRQYSVPIVLEDNQGRLVGINVIDRPVAEPSDFQPLQFLSEVAEPDFVRGIVLTLGGESKPYNDQLASLPIQTIWSKI